MPQTRNDLTMEEELDAFVTATDELRGFAVALFGKNSRMATAAGNLLEVAEREAKAYLESTWNTTEAEEYYQAHRPVIARLAAAHRHAARRRAH